MKKALVVALASLAALASPARAEAPPQPQAATIVASEPGKAVAAEIVERRSRVREVDVANRIVTLEDSKGKVTIVSVGEEVKNLAQVKPGDHVVVRSVQALALELKKTSSGIRERREREETVRAAPGEKPRIAGGRQVTVVADVMAVDRKKHTVTLRGPRRTVDLVVENPEQLKLVKKGDQVEATFIEAVAVSVEPAPKKSAKK